MRKRDWRQDYKRRLQFAMMSIDYVKLREKYVVRKWQLPEGCKNAEHFDEIMAEWWKEYDCTEVGCLGRKLFEISEEDSAFDAQGAHAQQKEGLSFVDYETSVVRCLEECETVASHFGLTKEILLHSLFLPEETVRSIDELDPSRLIPYEIVSSVPIYEDSPLGARLIKAAEESDEVREALRHFKFTPRVTEFVRGVEVLDELEPLATSAQVETHSKTRTENAELKVLSAYEPFSVTLHQLPPDLASALVESLKRRATRQIATLSSVAGFKMPQRRGRKSNFLLALECARLKDDEGQSYADIGRQFGWKLQYDDYRQRLNQCSTARHYVRAGRKLRQLLGISATK